MRQRSRPAVPDDSVVVEDLLKLSGGSIANGDCKGLYVTNKMPKSFEVRELGGGTSSIRIDYRIVVLRKNYENVRFADHTNDPDPRKMQERMKSASQQTR
jgi:hypothetical protein